jgi:hypothetical protein
MGEEGLSREREMADWKADCRLLGWSKDIIQVVYTFM